MEDMSSHGSWYPVLAGALRQFRHTLRETGRRFFAKEAVAVKVAVVGTERAAGQHASGGGR